jgi:hypothetical protein
MSPTTACSGPQLCGPNTRAAHTVGAADAERDQGGIMSLMQYFEILIIPALMICDYYLTLMSNKLRFEGYSNYFDVKNYELNPIWVKDINKHRIVNLKHLSLVFLATLFIFYLYKTENNSNYYKFLYGAILTNFMLVNSRHIANILLFKYIKNNPTAINGRVVLSEGYVYTLSAIQYVSVAITILPLAILSRSFYIYGAFFGCLFITGLQILWYRKKKNEEERLSNNATHTDS